MASSRKTKPEINIRDLQQAANALGSAARHYDIEADQLERERLAAAPLRSAAEEARRCEAMLRDAITRRLDG